MHHIYHTEGIILGSNNFGETGKYYSIFTKDLGMIYASAQGVRKVSSKLRFVLQDFSYIKIDLVKGKDFWRITSVSKTNKLENLFQPKILEVVVKISQLLKRLLAGEDPNESLFADLLSGLCILEKLKTDDEIRNMEAVMVLRILNNLGYIGEDYGVKDLIKSPFEESVLFNVSQNRVKILNQINKALKETHL
jgi:DNA repair protein RecO